MKGGGPRRGGSQVGVLGGGWEEVMGGIEGGVPGGCQGWGGVPKRIWGVTGDPDVMEEVP